MIKWLATFLVLWFIYAVREVFPPIIVGGIIAYLLLPLVSALSAKMRVPIGIATAIVYIVMAGVAAVGAWYFLPAAIREIAELANHRHEIISNVIAQIANFTHWGGDVNALSNTVMNNMTETVGNASEIANIGKSISHGALAVLVCVVSSIYFTLDSGSVGKFFLRYLPEDRRAEAVLLANQMNRLLTKYVQGQVILIGLMSVVAWCFLHFAMHMKYALPVAILSGFLEIIPVLGPILAITTAVLVGIWQLGPACAPIIIGFYTIARWVEDYVVVPKVIGHAVELHPLAVIFAVLCGEKLAGALGMLIAIPVAACIKLFIDFFYFGVNQQGDPVHDPEDAPILRDALRPEPEQQESEDQDPGSVIKTEAREPTPVSDPR